jgi:hypothetical protein
MSKKNTIKTAIQELIKTMMDRVMDNVLYQDPFIKEHHHAKRPLYAALVPDEIFKGAHFERRFVTPFGTMWERLALVAANAGLGYGVTQHRIDGVVPEDRLRRITEILNRLEHTQRGQQRTKPDWASELAYVMAGGGESLPVTVVCDVYCEDQHANKRYSFELKAPLPSSDLSKISKERLLKLYAMEPRQIDEAYYALPYNPYGTKEKYSWSFPARWFNMTQDPVVLIGEEFWDKIGGTGTYGAFIEAVNEVGAAYKIRIYREFLGVEPPPDAFENIL